MSALELVAGMALQGLVRLAQPTPANREHLAAVPSDGASRELAPLTGAQLRRLRAIEHYGRGAQVNAQSMIALHNRGLVTLHDRGDGHFTATVTRRGRALAVRAR